MSKLWRVTVVLPLRPGERRGVKRCYLVQAPTEGAAATDVPAPPKPPPKQPGPSKRPLGATQLSVLSALKHHGKWPGGWVWDTDSGTERVLESLWLRELVRREPVAHPKTGVTTGFIYYPKATK